MPKGVKSKVLLTLVDGEVTSAQPVPSDANIWTLQDCLDLLIMNGWTCIKPSPH